MPNAPLSLTHTRLYTAGTLLFLLTGLAHTIGQFAPSRPGFAERAVQSMMRGASAGDSGMTYWNIMMDWGAMYGLMSLLFGVSLLVVRRAGADARVLRALSRVAMIAAAGQAIISLFYRTPPPVFFMAPAAAVFAMVGFRGLERPSA